FSFFFQAEDGIRDDLVTGVQTCALPILVEPAFDFDEAEEADDGWQLEADGHRPYLAVMNRDHLHLPLAPERNRLLPVNDFERLEIGRASCRERVEIEVWGESVKNKR